MTTAYDEVLRDPELALLFAALRDAAEGPVPVPSPALTAVLDGATPITTISDRNTARASIIALVTAGVVAAGVGAAAADRLPAPAQRAVVSVVNNLTPFRLPEPRTERVAKPHHAPAPAHLFGTDTVRPDAEPTSTPITVQRGRGTVTPAPKASGSKPRDDRGSSSGSHDSAPTAPKQSGSSAPSGSSKGESGGTTGSSDTSGSDGTGGDTSGKDRTGTGSPQLSGDSAAPGD
jgi:hypothetical protein